MTLTIKDAVKELIDQEQWLAVKIIALKMIEESEAEPEWVEWYGGKRPVPGDTKVNVRYANGKQAGPRRAGTWNWRHLFEGYNIVAYQVVK